MEKERFTISVSIRTGMRWHLFLDCTYQHVTGSKDTFGIRFIEVIAFSRTVLWSKARDRRQLSSIESVAFMEQTLHLSAVQSRTHTIYTIQELLLEYSLVIIVLGCFLLVSLFSKFGGPKDGVSLAYRSQ